MTGERLELPPFFHHWSEVEQWLVSVYEKTNVVIPPGKYSPEISRNILKARQYIDSHYSSPIDIAEVARNAHMSYSYFSRCFHGIIGMPVSDYCTIVRITHAKEYLSHTADSIQQIASNVGYSDEKYFSRIFKKTTGFSPRDYRKSN